MYTVWQPWEIVHFQAFFKLAFFCFIAVSFVVAVYNVGLADVFLGFFK